MPFEERRRLDARLQRQTPARNRRHQREDRPGTNVADGHRAPAVVSGDDRRALGGGRRDDERNRKVNQQRVQSADECHLQIQTATARELFPGIKPAGRGLSDGLMPLRAFEETVLPHLDAAFNYARWLTKNSADAEDVVQDACVRAMRFLSSLRDDDARAWLFAIVRNTWYSRVSRRANMAEATPLDSAQDERPDVALDPEERLLQQHTVALVRAALEQLPVDFREVIVLREFEGLSYKEIAAVVRVPIGTVMSRLARARERLMAVLKLTAPMETLR